MSQIIQYFTYLLSSSLKMLYTASFGHHLIMAGSGIEYDPV